MGISGRRRDGGVRGGGERRRRRRSGGKNRGGGERSGEREEGPGRPGVALASSRRDEGEPGRLGGRRWPGRVRARVGHAPSSWQGEEDDRGGGGGLGRYSGGLAPLVATQVRPGKLSLSSVF